MNFNVKEQRPAQEAESYWIIQEFPCILYPQIQYDVASCAILSQMNSIYALSSYFFKRYFNL